MIIGFTITTIIEIVLGSFIAGALTMAALIYNFGKSKGDDA